jgi:hypothetical protein
MDGVRLREVSAYNIETDRRAYRWDALVHGAQLMFYAPDVKPGQLEKARADPRKALRHATDSLPLLKGCVYI